MQLQDQHHAIYAGSGVAAYGALGHMPRRVLEILSILQLLPAL